MKPINLAATALLVAGTPVSVLAADSAPSVPGNLMATLYPGAGGEIFWQRSTDDRGVRGYEITKNGTSLGIKDVLSYYDSSLQADAIDTFTVTAVDTANQRSDVASVTLNATNSQPGDSTEQPLAPADLKVVRYSHTAAELFWTRPDAVGLRYEVSRNDEVLSVTDGTSYFDNTLSGTEPFYNYVVVAIDSSGKRSAASLIVLNADGSSGVPVKPPSGPGTDPTPVPHPDNPTQSDSIDSLLTSVGSGSPLSVDNSRSFLPILFRLANAEPVRLVQERFVGLFEEALAAQDGRSDSRLVALSTSTDSSTFACPEGGRYTLADSPNGLADDVDYRHSFEECLFDNESLDGDILTYYVNVDDPSRTDITSVTPSDGRAFTYTDSDGVTFTLDGFYDDVQGLSSNDRFLWGGKLDMQLDNRTLSMDSITVSEGKSLVEDSNASQPYNQFTSQFTVTGTLTNGRTLSAESLDGFRRFSDKENFSVGQLVVKDASGGQLNLRADASTADGFTVRIDTEGQVDQYMESWSDSLNFVKFPVPAN